MQRQDLVIGLDFGGTSIKGLVATGPADIRCRFRVATGEPDDTLRRLGVEIAAACAADDVRSLGIAAFGPIVRDSANPSYGALLDTPKSAWRGVNLISALAEVFRGPIVLDTDVNGALLGECAWGAGVGLNHAVYVTIGTGVGLGILGNGALIGIPGHPEGGHIQLRRKPRAASNFAGICPFHGDCVEGLVSAPAIRARSGIAADALPAAHPIWDEIAHDLAQLCLTLTYLIRPERIMLGGGVMQQDRLFDQIRTHFGQIAASYALGRAQPPFVDYITPPSLHQDAGALGAVWLAQQHLKGRA